jgi:hypothetical protein
VLAATILVSRAAAGCCRKVTEPLHGESPPQLGARSAFSCYRCAYSRGVGRGAGVGRDLGVGVGLGVALGVGVAVATGVGLGVCVGVVVAVGVGVGVVEGVGVGVGVPSSPVPMSRNTWSGAVSAN